MHTEQLNQDPTSGEALSQASDELIERLHIEHLTEAQYTDVVALAEDFVSYATHDDLVNGVDSAQHTIDTQFSIFESLRRIARSDDRHITPELQDAHRLFTGHIFQYISYLERAGNNEEAKTVASVTVSELFSSSPNIASYSGNPADQFELLSLAQSTPLARNVGSHMVGELVYQAAFELDASEFLDALQDKSPIQQLQSMQALRDISLNALSNGDWAEPAAEKASIALERVSADPSNSELVRLVAEAHVADIEQEINTEWVYLEDLPADEQARLLADHAEQQKRMKDEQRSLKEDFQHLPTEQGTHLVRLAKDAAATWEHRGITDIELKVIGEKDSIVEKLDVVQGTDKLNLTANQSMLLAQMHHPEVRHLVENQLGLSLSEISLGAQVRLLDYMCEAGADDFQQLQGILQATPEEERALVGEAFLALEFGDDLAKTILNIAESADTETSMEVFHIVERFRNNSKAFGQWFKGLDPNFAVATEQAMSERLTDGLATVAQVATDGKLQLDLGVGGKYSLDGLSAALEDMKLADKSLQIIVDVMANHETTVSRITEPNDEFSMYRFYNEEDGEVILYVRPVAAHSYDPMYEYGNRKGVEASISFIANPTNPQHIRADKDPNGVSFRFDREGRRVDESPFSEDRTPVRPDGLISLDISSVLGKSDTPGVRIGKFFAAGNSIRASKTSRRESLHHNTNFFDQETYGSDTGFKKLAKHVEAMAEAAQSTQRRQNTRKRIAKAALKAQHATDQKLVA